MSSLRLEPKFVTLLRRFRVTPEKMRQRRSSGPGAHLSKGLGQSLDFSEYRPYQPGDDLRSLDWKVYARTDRLYTKLYVPEQEETVCFLLDLSGSMESKWSFLQTTVMGLASVVLGQGDRVSLLALSRDGKERLAGVPPVRGKSNLARVARFLESARPEGVTDLDETLDEMARRLKTRAHLVVLSDFLKPGAGIRGLSQLHYRRHRLSLLQLLSPEELDPRTSLSPGEWELFDPEPEAEDSPNLRLELGRGAFQKYGELLAGHNALLQEFSRSTGAVYIQASTQTPPISYFSEDLRQGGLLA